MCSLHLLETEIYLIMIGKGKYPPDGSISSPFSFHWFDASEIGCTDLDACGECTGGKKKLKQIAHTIYY